MIRVSRCLQLSLVTMIGVSAATLQVTTGGVYAAGTPTSTWTKPGGSWTVSFTVDSNAAATPVGPESFIVPITAFVYTLNGTAVNVGTVDIALYTASNGGLFNLCFFGCDPQNVINGIEVFGPQAFSGPVTSPTILTGSYAETRLVVDVTSVATLQPPGTVTIVSSASSSPIPSSLILLLIGFGLMVFISGRRRWFRGTA